MHYSHLSEKEREQIGRLRGSGRSLCSIARLLGRSPGTISRELARNGVNGGYHGGVAQLISEERTKNASRRRPLKLRGKLLVEVRRRLKQRWPPETIAGSLRGRSSAERVSHETIYAYIWQDKQAGGDLWRYLRHGRRRKRKIASRSVGKIPGRVPISARPSAVEDRGRIGDFEGDTLVGKQGQSYVVTTVDRKSRLLFASLVLSKTARAVRRTQQRQLSSLPMGVSKTLTLDNGTEFAEHEELARRLSLSVYFADPYSSWQRGTNENTNGLLRQYFPKGTDFRQVSPQRLASVVRQLNNRPRKCLGYRTPRDVFYEELRRQSVALQI